MNGQIDPLTSSCAIMPIEAIIAMRQCLSSFSFISLILGGRRGRGVSAGRRGGSKRGRVYPTPAAAGRRALLRRVAVVRDETHRVKPVLAGHVALRVDETRAQALGDGDRDDELAEHGVGELVLRLQRVRAHLRRPVHRDVPDGCGEPQADTREHRL